MESSGLPPSPMDRLCPEMDARMADWAVYSSTAAPWQHHQQHAVNTSSRVDDNPAGLQAGSLLQTDSTDWHDSFESLLSTDLSSEAEGDETPPPDCCCFTGDGDWDDQQSTKDDDGESTVDSKLQKNQKERDRMKRKRVLLEKLVSHLKASTLISETDKKRRFTEAYTVSMTVILIRALEEQTARLGQTKKRLQHHYQSQQVAAGGHPRASCKKKKKPSNAFISFSAHYRPCFVHVLKEAGEGSGRVKNPSQKVVQKMAAEVWNKLAVEDKVGWQKHSIQSVMEWAKNTVAGSP